MAAGTTEPIAALVPDIVLKDLMLATISTVPMFRNGFMTREEDSTAGMVIYKDDFQSYGVKSITMGLALVSDDEGIQGDAELDGNEEELEQETFSLDVEQLRHAHKLKGRSALQKSPIDLIPTILMANKAWLVKRMQKEFFYQATGKLPTGKTAWANTPTAPTDNRIVYSGDATSDATIDSSDTFSLDDIKAAKIKFMDQQEATATTDQLNPIEYLERDDGIQAVTFLNLKSFQDFLEDTELQSLYQRAGAVKQNTYFTGDEWNYLGNLIVPTPYIGKFVGGAADSVYVARNIMCGKNAVAIGVASEVKFIEEVKDYGNQKGYGVSIFGGMKKIKYSNQDDMGIVAMDSYVGAVS